MICPHCHRNFEGGFCPHCGAVKGIVKTSTILISSGEKQNVYRSVEEVPDSLKQQLVKSTSGLNSATIVIADREGRKEIAKAIRNLPASENPLEPRPKKLRRALLHGVGVVLLLAAAVLIWFIFRRTS
jgi:glutaredoxin